MLCLRCEIPGKTKLCEICQKKLKQATAIRRKYLRKFHALKMRRYYGKDQKDINKACSEEMEASVAFDKELHATGYRSRDLDVDGFGRNSLILITKAWRKWRRKRKRLMFKSMKLQEQGDYKGFREIEAYLQKHWYDNPDKSK